MYGFIYNTLRNLVIESYGEAAWMQICDDAGVNEMKEGILDRHYYDESYLQTVGTAASIKLGVSKETIMEMFGAFFFKTCKKSGHSSILRTLGHNLYGFLLNLDTLHDHLSFTYTQMRAPSFRCEKTANGQGLTLFYYSHRHGLSHIVAGIVKAVAKDFFQLDIIVKQVHYEEGVGNKLSHHYVFSIEVEESAKIDNYLERLTGDINIPSIMSPLDEVDVQSEDAEAQHHLFKHQNADCPGAGPGGAHISFSLNNSYYSGGGGGDGGCPVSIENSGEDGNHLGELDKAASKESSGEEPAAGTRLGLSHQEENVIRDEIRRVSDDRSVGEAQFMPLPQLPAFSMSRFQSRRGSIAPWDSSDWPITVHLFQVCFPFHIIFDKDLIIRYMGISLTRLFPKAVINGARLSDYFDLDRPKINFNYKNIRTSLHNNFVIFTKPTVVFPSSVPSRGSLYFRGQMILTSKNEASHMLFLCSPRVSSVEELEHQGLYLSDIPVHDVTRDLLLLNRHFRVEMNIAAELEQTKNDLEIQKARVDQERQRADNLLHSMLPPSIATQLKTKGEVTATDYSSVTILFSDIKKFTNICSSCKPIEVVGMLNSLYTLFDVQSENHQVYKVETIGDAYMVAAGLLDTPAEHAQAVTNMAFGMMKEAGRVMEPTNQVPLQVRIGIHTGPIVAGVVGKRMPRYCLFGTTVNTASRMESHGEPGKVHISETTHSELVGSPEYIFENRGKIPIKGLGEQQTYFVEPANPDAISVCKIEDENSFTDPAAVGSDPGLPHVNQCWLVKVPSSTRQKCPSPFSEEDDDNKPVVVDMIKPQAPVEGAWGNSQPSGSDESEPNPEPIPLTEIVHSKPQHHEAAPVAPRVSKVTPALKTDSGETQKSNPALFIASGPTGGADQQGGTDSPRSRSRSKCVIC